VKLESAAISDSASRKELALRCADCSCRRRAMLNTYLSYQLINRDIDRSIDRIGKQPLVDRETKYYLDNITKVKTVDDFVSDSRLFKYAMKAFGLGDMDYAKAFMAKALKEGVEDPDSFANKLSDKRYAEFVRTFNFASRRAHRLLKAQH